MSLEQWAVKWGISDAALEDLRAAFGCLPVVVNKATTSEAAIQNQVRLEGARKGNIKLFRNNVGALKSEDGRWVRFGLANESERENKAVKSADLIGWRSVLITPEHVGTHIAQFVSRECKRAGWKFTGDSHEQAQLKWAQAVMADGGDAKFTSGEETL